MKCSSCVLFYTPFFYVSNFRLLVRLADQTALLIASPIFSRYPTALEGFLVPLAYFLNELIYDLQAKDYYFPYFQKSVLSFKYSI